MNVKTIRKAINDVLAGPDLEDTVAAVCRGCGNFMNTGDGLDPSALCNLCAQTKVTEFARIIEAMLPIVASVGALELTHRDQYERIRIIVLARGELQRTKVST